MSKNPLKDLVRKALKEDVGSGDLTTSLLVPEKAKCRARLMARGAGVLSGMRAFSEVFRCLQAHLEDWESLEDGAAFEKGDTVAEFKALAGPVLTGERTAMNFVQHLSGVATLTRAFVDAVKGFDVQICDTRKTMPMLRSLEKEAVVHGGGTNHRHALFDGILIKENHIAAAGGIQAALDLASQGAHHLMRVEVEVRNLGELEEAVSAGAEAVLLDNMSLDDMRAAAERLNGARVILEASGNVGLAGVRDVAETGVDLISVGALTHSAPSADLSLLIEME